jgi:hypothetical protein
MDKEVPVPSPDKQDIQLENLTFRLDSDPFVTLLPFICVKSVFIPDTLIFTQQLPTGVMD